MPWCTSIAFIFGDVFSQNITDHGEEATKYLRAFIGEHYAYSEKPIFEALWESYNRCQFVEDECELSIDLSVGYFCMIILLFACPSLFSHDLPPLRVYLTLFASPSFSSHVFPCRLSTHNFIRLGPLLP